MSHILYDGVTGRSHKVVVAAKFANVELKRKEIAIGTDNKTPEYLAINPTGQTPTLVTPQGPIRESTAIMRYIARLRTDHKLYGSTAFEAGLVEQWCEYITISLDSPFSQWLYPVLGFAPFKQGVYFAAKKDTIAVLKFVNQHFHKNTYFVGNTITLADILLYSFSHVLVQYVIAPEVLKEIPHFKRWFVTVGSHPYFSETFGPIVFASAEKLAPGQADAKKETKKEAPAKKEEKKEAPAPTPAPKVEKVVNPLDTLPPTTMKLDDVKRSFFLRRPFNDEYFPGQFWENFDHEGYSIYETEYAYPEDLEKDSYTDNLCTGFLSRCEGTKKYAFACANVVKIAEGQYQIYSAFVIRGPEINAELKDVTDFEEYTFTKLDSKNPEHQQRFNEIFTSEDKVKGAEIIYKRYLK